MVKKHKNKTVVSPEEPWSPAVIFRISRRKVATCRNRGSTLHQRTNRTPSLYNKPVKTLERQFPSAKQKPPIEEQKNVIYQIPSLVPSRSAGATKNEPIDKTSLGMTSVSCDAVPSPQLPLSHHKYPFVPLWTKHSKRARESLWLGCQIPCQDCSWSYMHTRNRKIPEDEKVRTRKECETKQEGVVCCKTRMDSRSCNWLCQC